MSTLIRQVSFESANRKKDKSVSLRFITSLEQSTDEFAELDRMIDFSGVLVFSDRGKLTDQELNAIKTVDVKNEGKSKSTQLRNALFGKWQRKGSQGDFSDFYASEMDVVINFTIESNR